MQETWRERFRRWHHEHERAMEAFFFCAGFLFDIIAVGEGADHLLMVVQQILYLALIGFILYKDILREARGGEAQFSSRIERWWSYRGLALHFCLGTLMNIYSLFFLMSASFFSSIAFVLLLFGALVLNELKALRRRGVDLKVALYVVCVFCFLSLMFPLLLGRVGRLPFALAFAGTILSVALFHRSLRRRTGPDGLRQRLLIPGYGVSALFLVFYLLALIPPVPLVARKMGIYHRVEKAEGDYLLHHERPWWKFWQRGDQDFVARPGDRIFFFVAISSVARFDDTVIVHWMYHDERLGWRDSDRIPLRISGGRREGYRGFAAKQNFDFGSGSWRVSVETQDGREIGRIYFRVTKAEADPARSFQVERY